MRGKIIWILVFMASFILLSGGLGFSQEETAVVTETPTEPETQWLWGEVVSVDIQKNEILVKYLDYETEQEKEVTINVDDKTTYENIKTLSELKPKDTLSIDYLISQEGKNIAKNIFGEKPETPETLEEKIIPEETTTEEPGGVLPQE